MATFAERRSGISPKRRSEHDGISPPSWHALLGNSIRPRLPIPETGQRRIRYHAFKAPSARRGELVRLIGNGQHWRLCRPVKASSAISSTLEIWAQPRSRQKLSNAIAAAAPSCSASSWQSANPEVEDDRLR